MSYRHWSFVDLVVPHWEYQPISYSVTRKGRYSCTHDIRPAARCSSSSQRHWTLLFCFCELIIKEKEEGARPPEINGSINKTRACLFPVTECGSDWRGGGGAAGGGFRAVKLHHKEKGCRSWPRARAESSSNSCTETTRSAGFAPPKHQLSPPISLVGCALLIQRGAWGGPGSDGAQAHSVLPCVWRESARSGGSEVYARTKQKLGPQLRTWANLL